MVHKMTYLDHNATTPVLPEAAAAVSEVMRLSGVNPSSAHELGRDARRRIESAREAIGALVNSQTEEVVFTSSGTEADNMVIMGEPWNRVLISETEHSAILKTALLRNGRSQLLPVDREGVVNLDVLDARLAEDDANPALVCVMAANNETGVLQPIQDVVRIARSHGALVLCDAVQAVGKINVDFDDWNVDYLALSAHKIGGPQGVGALVCRQGTKLNSLVTGGGQERGMRAGTENVPGIVGFGVAAEIVAKKWRGTMELLESYRDQLELEVRRISPGSEIFSAKAVRLPNTSNFTLPGVRSDTQVMTLDLAGVAVSAGSACSSGKIEPSHVLNAMNVSKDSAATALRVSFGWDSKPNDVKSFIDPWSKMACGISGQETAA